MFEEDDIVEECPDCFYGFHWRPGPFGKLTMYICGTCNGFTYIEHDTHEELEYDQVDTR